MAGDISTKYKNSIQPAVAGNKPDIAAGRVDSTVGKQASVQSDNFDTEFNYAKNRYAQIYGPEVFATEQGKELAKNLKAQVVSRLINEGIQMQEIRRSGFAVDSKLMNVEFKTFLETMDINLDQFESGLKKRGYTLDYFRKKFEMNVLIKRYLDEKVLTGLTNDFEKQQRYSSWFNNAKLLAKVVFYDRELERLVRAQAARGGCSGGGSCSTGKSNKRL